MAVGIQGDNGVERPFDDAGQLFFFFLQRDFEALQRQVGRDSGQYLLDLKRLGSELQFKQVNVSISGRVAGELIPRHTEDRLLGKNLGYTCHVIGMRTSGVYEQ